MVATNINSVKNPIAINRNEEEDREVSSYFRTSYEQKFVRLTGAGIPI